MRLNKFLAKAGVASRRESDRLIQAATTFVNGKLILDPAFSVTEDDEVVFDNQRIRLKSDTIVLMLNKPKNTITTVKDTHGRRTVLDLIPTQERLFPIGRLDKDTTGLILLTNDGELANYLMHPKNRIPRIYRVEIEGRLDLGSSSKMERGMYIGEGEFGRAKILNQKTVKKRSVVTLELRRGKKREIRRMFHFLDIRLFSLHRIHYGSISLGDLEQRHWRYLTDQEIKELKQKHQ